MLTATVFVDNDFTILSYHVGVLANQIYHPFSFRHAQVKRHLEINTAMDKWDNSLGLCLRRSRFEDPKNLASSV